MLEDKKKLPIGLSDFKKIIEGNFYFVDKSLFIKELIDSGAAVTLIPRQRRFGKTLNLSILRYFFEKSYDKEREPLCCKLFDNLNITRYPKIMAEQGQYPVIFFTFKDVKQNSWSDTFNKIKTLIADEFRRHRYLTKDNLLDETQKKDFEVIIAKTADQSIYENSLKKLSEYLQQYHHKNVIILIDEYDEPINAGFANGFYKEIISFMRRFLSGGCKYNNSLERCVITGISRISKESIFSGVNNLRVCTTTNSAYSDKFGLLEEEVKTLLDYYDLKLGLDDIRTWYNGYGSWDLKVYNPWSIINLADTKGILKSYWVNTSDNILVKTFIRQGDVEIKEAFRTLLSGGSLKAIPVIEDIVFPVMASNINMLLNFLLSAGYLTYNSLQVKYADSKPTLIIPISERATTELVTKSLEELTIVDTEIMLVDLVIPNKEVFGFFQEAVLEWFTFGGQTPFRNLLAALTRADIDEFAENFQTVVMHNLSLFDVGDQEPERFYHAFVLGIFLNLQGTHIFKGKEVLVVEGK